MFVAIDDVCLIRRLTIYWARCRLTTIFKEELFRLCTNVPYNKINNKKSSNFRFMFSCDFWYTCFFFLYVVLSIHKHNSRR